jgi:hypothetical protein
MPSVKLKEQLDTPSPGHHFAGAGVTRAVLISDGEFYPQISRMTQMRGKKSVQSASSADFPIPHLNGFFPVVILRWMIGAFGVCQSRSDAMTIAQPFMAGSGVNQIEKSREGRQNGSFVPDGTLEICGSRVPAINGWAIFNRARNGA